MGGGQTRKDEGSTHSTRPTDEPQIGGFIFGWLHFGGFGFFGGVLEAGRVFTQHYTDSRSSLTKHTSTIYRQQQTMEATQPKTEEHHNASPAAASIKIAAGGNANAKDADDTKANDGEKKKDSGAGNEKKKEAKCARCAELEAEISDLRARLRQANQRLREAERAAHAAAKNREGEIAAQALKAQKARAARARGKKD